jgi:tripartite-type tricarboxylate transporter receptor subunit TctC
MKRRQFLQGAIACAAYPAVARPALAQSYPAHPIRLFVGFAAGGQVDIVTRVTAQWLGEKLGQSIVVENKPGAGGNLGAQAIVGAPADGYTLFMGTTANVINKWLIADLPYDFARDTTAIAAVNRTPLVLEINPMLAAKNVAELIAAAKASPGTINMGSPSAGTPPHLAVALFKMMAGVDIVQVPYFSENQMVTDLLGGQLMAAVGGVSAGIGHIRGGTLRALGVTTAERIAQLPDVPTIGETVPGFEASGWSALVAPKNTPKEIVDKIAAAMSAVHGDAKFRERLADVGVTPLVMPPDELGPFIVSETEKWGKVVKFAGLKPQ